MTAKLEGYRGYYIVLTEGGIFEAYESEADWSENSTELASSDTLLKLKKILTDLQAKGRFGQEAWAQVNSYSAHFDGWIKGKVSSLKPKILGSYSSRAYLRFTWKHEGHNYREEVSPTKLKKVTPPNEATFVKMAELRKEAQRLNDEAEGMEKGLEKYTWEDFGLKKEEME